jgi:glycylpeptide N-tetradecanoyltransferase
VWCFRDRALKPPGWRGEWHAGVRVKTSKKMVAFISAIPALISVRGKCVTSLAPPHTTHTTHTTRVQ